MGPALSLVRVLVVALALGHVAAATSRASEGSLTVMTLNTWNVNGPFEERADLIEKAIDDERPDVVALQEVMDPDPAQGEDVPFNLARELGRRLDYAVVYQEAARVQVGEGAYPEGLAILARHRIVGSSYVGLPVPSEGPGRIVLQATIATPWGLLDVLTTHLSTVAEDRQVQVPEVWRFVKGFSEGLPVILAGDFNSLPFSPVVRYLRGLYPIEGEVGGLRDLWEELRPNDPGFTFSTKNNPAEALNRRIDYVFVGPATPEGSGQGIEIRTILGEKGPSGFTASDHLGLVARLREVGSPAQGSSGGSAGGCSIDRGSSRPSPVGPTLLAALAAGAILTIRRVRRGPGARLSFLARGDRI